MSKLEREEHGAGATNTKERLASIIDGFDAFDTEMRVGTRQRQEKAAQRIAELRAIMAQLEKKLNSEIRRRLEMNRSVQAWAESQVTTAVERLETLVQEKDVVVHQRVDALAQRIDEVEVRFAQESARLVQETEERVAVLHGLFDELTVEFEAERKDRLVREGEILQRLSAHEVEVAADFEQERSTREDAITILRAAFDENVRVRAKADEQLQKFVQEELASLKNQISAEAVVREREDDEIVDALNRYTRKLQDSLQLINSPDV
mmetsp:Transcript_41418/g.129714  ORF Transcript_41418/g.129714 Transcript_41418/m.129714 type:complete len:264 (-) Transcript_41418:2529-3320(-)